MRSSNLTFGGYLAGTTLVLSARFSLFIVHVLFRVCEDYVAHWWFFFGIISWCRLWETRLAILSLPGHRVSWY